MVGTVLATTRSSVPVHLFYGEHLVQEGPRRDGSIILNEEVTPTGFSIGPTIGSPVSISGPLSKAIQTLGNFIQSLFGVSNSDKATDSSDDLGWGNWEGWSGHNDSSGDSDAPSQGGQGPGGSGGGFAGHEHMGL